MPQSKIARLAVVVFCGGVAVLGISLATWLLKGPNHLYYTTHTYEWVASRSSDRPALATDEIWFVRAECLRPFFQKEADQAQARLAAHRRLKPQIKPQISNKPDAVSGNAGVPTQQRMFAWEEDLARLREKSRFEQQGLDAVLKYLGKPVPIEEFEAIQRAVRENGAFNSSDWFALEIALQIRAERWTKALAETTDREMLLSDAINAKRIGIVEMVAAAESPNTQELIARGYKFKFGLAEFSDDNVQTIRAVCTNIVPIKRVIATTEYHTAIGRWPSEHAGAFWTGIALVLVGLLLTPLVRWIGRATN